MRKNRLFSSLFAFALVATATTAINNSALAAGNPNCTAVDGDYIVSLQRGASVDQELNNAPGGSIKAKFKYDVALNGFAATLKAEQVCAFQQNKNVIAIERDQIMTASGVQTGATWGLDRINQRALPLDGSYSYFDTATAGNVTAYVIDTGIDSFHSEFGGRVRAGYTAFADGNGTEDCNGHGTHVSGTIGGTTYGVAKNVKLVAIRVLDCAGSGAYSGVIAGIDWATGDFKSLAQKSAVANMSIGGPSSSALNSAVAGFVAVGVTVVVAAGNSKADACKSSPAGEPSAITVGATTSSDARASYSNYGTCLDIFAPGSAITSSWIGLSNTETSTISGTSMASPHVAGVAALYLSANPSASPAQVEAMLEGYSTSGVVNSIGTGSPNLLLAAPTAPAAVSQPPVVVTAPTMGSVSTASPRKGVLNASWSATSSGSSSIVKYVVTAYRGLTPQPNPITITTSALSASASFSGLLSGVDYTVGVIAFNAQSASSLEKLSLPQKVR